MTTKEALSIVLTALAGTSGVITAWYWWRSSQVEVDPPSPTLPGLPIHIDGDYSGTVAALKVVATLNKKAAGWSAVSTILFTISALI